MTRRRDIEKHRRKLSEIRDIMQSMKTLAYLETHKLNRLIDAQHVLVSNIEEVALDFLNFHSEVLPIIEPATNYFLLIGSQRGFCGDYNEVLLEHLRLTLESHRQEKTVIFAVGQKLLSHLDDLPCEFSFIEGANVAEEINLVVDSLARTLTSDKQVFASLYVLYHTAEDNSIISERLLPPFQQLHKKQTTFNYPPELNLQPAELLIDLTETYLFTALHRVLYDSLMSENQYRVQHLENAVSHLDDKTNELLRVANALRQEEIIEEIEVILLNTPSIA